MRILLILGLAFPLMAPSALAADLGSINFPTSARSEEAQKHFVRGVLLLHSFTYELAGAAFRDASRLEPDFAMAYWGEALSYNHPLQPPREADGPRAVLARLASTPSERIEVAKTEKEKGWLRAVDVLFGEGSHEDRARAYAGEMRGLAERFPEDHEIQAFYAVALLSLAWRTSDPDFRIRIRAGAIAQEIYRDNPNHPGAAHYIIHAFDDPVHAPLALSAAHRYAAIAPDSAHALHMPSHIFIQHGMWPEVVESNKASYESAVRLWHQRETLDETAKHYNDMYVWHALDWGQYGSLQLRDYEGAQRAIELLRPVAEKSDAARVKHGPAEMYARYVVESEKWEALSIEDAPPAQVLAAGLSAVQLGQIDRAKRAEAKLRALASAAEGKPQGRRGNVPAVRPHLVGAMIALAEGRGEEALGRADSAIELVEAMDPPNGAATPIKPAHELKGEILLALGRMAEAAESFETCLSRMPERALSVRGLRKAREANAELSAAPLLLGAETRALDDGDREERR